MKSTFSLISQEENKQNEKELNRNTIRNICLIYTIVKKKKYKEIL